MTGGLYGGVQEKCPGTDIIITTVDFQQFEGSISSIKEDLTESFHLERRRI